MRGSPQLGLLRAGPRTNHAAGKLRHQADGPVHSEPGIDLIHAALEAVGGFAGQGETPGRLADGFGTEYGALNHDVAAGVGNFRIKPAHDPGERNRLHAVADQQVGGGQHTLLTVKGHKALAVTGHGDFRASAFQLVAVKGVQRLPQLHQNIVGDVHNVGNGTDTHGVQTVAHPHGRLPDGHAFHKAQLVERAQVGIRDVHRPLRSPIRPLCLHMHLGQRQRQLESQRRFAGKAEYGQAVAAVRGDADFQNLRIQIQRVDEAGADFEAFGQHHDAVMIFGKPQLSLGADHAERGHAAQLGLLDDHTAGHRRTHQRHRDLLPGGHIGRTAHDVQHFFLSDIHRAYGQMIRVGMGLFRQDVPDDDVLDGIIRMDDVFQLQPKHRQAIADFLSPGFHRNKFAQPFQT